MSELSDNAKAIYQRLYISKEMEETSPTDVHMRVARFVASAERTDEDRVEYEYRFFELMEKNIFRPNSPTLMNGGVSDRPAILSACFVGHLEDDLISILDLDKEAAIIFSHGAGIGVNWGVLREKNAPLSSGGRASGPISFMRKLNATADCVKSGGRARRAAIWSGLFDNHPDIEEFITCKQQCRELQAMNLSVVASDAFMHAVENNQPWELRSVVDGHVVKTVQARDLFRLICECAHRSGDPGLIFIDRINRDNTTPSMGRIIATNPCGEEPLLPRGSCCLGSINVASFVAPDGFFDLAKLYRVVSTCVRFLDNVLDLTAYPTEDYREVSMATRNIGLGIMGLADLMVMLGMGYGSDEALTFAQGLSKSILDAAIEASAQLASERGPAPAFRDNKEHIISFVKSRGLKTALDLVTKFGVRNCQWTTIAPTGSISLSADCSQGMEPYFAITYAKRLSDTDQTLYITPQPILDLYDMTPYFDEIANNKGSCQNIEDIPEEIRAIAVCAHDIPWDRRLAMQAALQKYTSAAISSTVNLPSNATVEDVAKIYTTAHKCGLKGITIYRDGSHEQQPVVFGGSKSRETVGRPAILRGITHKVRTGHGNIYLTVNTDESGRVLELFTNGGKNGTAGAANLEALARVMSIALQEGVSIERLTRTLIGINDGTCVWVSLKDGDGKPVQITSIPDAVGKTLAAFYTNKRSDFDGDAAVLVQAECPECGSAMYYTEGCVMCYSCGWSKCS